MCNPKFKAVNDSALMHDTVNLFVYRPGELSM